MAMGNGLVGVVDLKDVMAVASAAGKCVMGGRSGRGCCCCKDDDGGGFFRSCCVVVVVVVRGRRFVT